MGAKPPVDYETVGYADERMVQAHRYFSEQAREWLSREGAEQIGTRADAIETVVRDLLQMVVIDLGADENAQEIFETLNARGAQLTAADLIKNFIFQRLLDSGADVEDAYERYWRNFESAFWEAEISVGRLRYPRSAVFLNHWLADRDARLRELTVALTKAQEQELQLRKQQRELQSQQEALKLDVARQLDAERQTLIQEAKVQFNAEHELKQAEKDKTIADLASKLKEMQRKVEQGSQQLQGEVQELALERILGDSFPVDEVDPIGKGVGGGDCLQSVVNHAGQVCGRILWESKRTKRWGGDWSGEGSG